eukprot:s1569_g8.t1
MGGRGGRHGAMLASQASNEELAIPARRDRHATAHTQHTRGSSICMGCVGMDWWGCSGCDGFGKAGCGRRDGGDNNFAPIDISRLISLHDGNSCVLAVNCFVSEFTR